MQLGEILAIVGIGLAIIAALLWKEVSALPSYVKWPGVAFGAGLILSAVMPLNPLHTVMSFAVISILWGVGWSAKNDLDDPFRQLRSPPSPESFGVRLDMSERQIDAYRMLLGLKIVNLRDMHLKNRCFVKIIETDLGEAVTSMLPSEIALRTENQVRRGQKGQSRFTLSIGELKTVPVLFCEPHRRINFS
jgi:hypothetical protein